MPTRKPKNLMLDVEATEALDAWISARRKKGYPLRPAHVVSAAIRAFLRLSEPEQLAILGPMVTGLCVDAEQAAEESARAASRKPRSSRSAWRRGAG
jgi:hypothetical protein